MSVTTVLPFPAPASRRAVRALTAALAAGDVTFCRHLGRPGLGALWAMWAPGAMVCPDCSPMLNLTGEENYRCDHCHTVTEAIYPLITICLGLVISHGACRDCAGPIAAPPERRTA